MRVHGELQPEADLSSPSPRAARGQFGLAPPPGGCQGADVLA